MGAILRPQQPSELANWIPTGSKVPPVQFSTNNRREGEQYRMKLRVPPSLVARQKLTRYRGCDCPSLGNERNNGSLQQLSIHIFTAALGAEPVLASTPSLGVGELWGSGHQRL